MNDALVCLCRVDWSSLFRCRLKQGCRRWGKGRGPVGRSINPISTRGKIMPTTLLRVPPPDFQTFLRPCKVSALCTWTLCGTDSLKEKALKYVPHSTLPNSTDILGLFTLYYLLNKMHFHKSRIDGFQWIFLSKSVIIIIKIIFAKFIKRILVKFYFLQA